MSEEREQPMPTVCPSEGSMLSYPEVMPNADRWLWDDARRKGTVLVTEHGLRRLLRLVKQSQAILMFHTMKPSGDNPWAEDVAFDKIAPLARESASIFCEGSLVMSRLFVTPDGAAIAHPDEEVDSASIPPWERAAGPSQTPPPEKED